MKLHKHHLAVQAARENPCAVRTLELARWEADLSDTRAQRRGLRPGARSNFVRHPPSTATAPDQMTERNPPTV